MKFYKLRDPGGYMSNYYRATFKIYDREWLTVEHAYQAQKCTDPNEYDAIHEATRANDARLLGQKVQMRKDWDQVKFSVMEECVRAKFQQHDDLRESLLATGNEELIEDSPVDYYWGCGADGTGQNMLGKVLMKIREEFRNA